MDASDDYVRGVFEFAAELERDGWVLWRPPNIKTTILVEAERFLELAPEVDFCSRCNEHAAWLHEDGEWLSECCSARPVETDPS